LERRATLFGAMGYVALFLMMFLIPQRAIDDHYGGICRAGGSLPAFAFWLFREACWWWFVAVLAAVLVRFILDSPAWQEAAAPLRKRHGPAASP
jgi:hypothetical protein